MYKENILHPAEQNILLALTLAICLSLYAGWASNLITEYNENVAYKQERLMHAANEGKNRSGKIDFSFHCYSTPGWHLIYALQFLSLPLAFRYFTHPSPRNVVKTTCISSLSLLSFFFWYLSTNPIRDYLSEIPAEKVTLINLIFYEATPYHVTAFVLGFIMFSLQIAFLLRFVGERRIQQSI